MQHPVRLATSIHASAPLARIRRLAWSSPAWPFDRVGRLPDTILSKPDTHLTSRQSTGLVYFSRHVPSPSFRLPRIVDDAAYYTRPDLTRLLCSSLRLLEPVTDPALLSAPHTFFGQLDCARVGLTIWISISILLTPQLPSPPITPLHTSTRQV